MSSSQLILAGSILMASAAGRAWHDACRGGHKRIEGSGVGTRARSGRGGASG